VLAKPIVEEALTVRILSMCVNEPMPIRIGDYDPIAEMQRIIVEWNAPAPPTVEWTST
jgi:hypothetical protein